MIQSTRRFAALAAGILLFSSSFGQSPFMRMVKPTATEEILQTKARKYTPANGNGPAIWLVGVAHVGRADYYKELQKLLDLQTTVLYEGVTRKGADPTSTPADPKDDPRQRSTYQALSEALNLQFQLFGIDYKRPNFHNADLSWEEMNALEAKEPKGKPGMSLSTIGNMLDTNTEQGKQVVMALSTMKNDPSSIEAMHLVMIEALSAPGAIEAMLSPSMSNLLIRSRNSKVLSNLRTELSNPSQKSIAIFFGAGHMADMEQHLTKDFNYVPGEEKWFSAIDGDTNKVTSDTGKMVLQMARAQFAQKKKGGG